MHVLSRLEQVEQLPVRVPNGALLVEFRCKGYQVEMCHDVLSVQFSAKLHYFSIADKRNSTKIEVPDNNSFANVCQCQNKIVILQHLECHDVLTPHDWQIVNPEEQTSDYQHGSLVRVLGWIATTPQRHRWV